MGERQEGFAQGCDRREPELGVGQGARGNQLAIGLAHGLGAPAPAVELRQAVQQPGRVLGRAPRGRLGGQIVLEQRGVVRGCGELVLVFARLCGERLIARGKVGEQGAHVGRLSGRHDRVEAVRGCGRGVQQRGQHTRHARVAVPLQLAATRAVLLEEPPAGLLATGLGQHALHGVVAHALRAVLAQNHELWVEPQRERVGVQDARAHAMDRGNPGAVHLEGLVGEASAPQLGAQALLDLAGCFLSEGDDQSLVYALQVCRAIRRRAGQQGADHALREREGFARARTGCHKDRLVQRGGHELLCMRERHYERLLSQLATGHQLHT